MLFRAHVALWLALFLFLGGADCVFPAIFEHEKVSVYDDGIFFYSEGSLPNGPCFRIHGHANAPDFFHGLKRIDTSDETVFRRGKETVTQFPDQLLLTFVIYDWPCDTTLHSKGPRLYLTRELMSNVHFSLYWKCGIDLRPVRNAKLQHATVTSFPPDAVDRAREVPERLMWTFVMEVPSTGVPLTDSLALIFRTEDQHIAARVAARL